MSTMFLSLGLSMEVLCYFFMSTAAIIFIYLFSKTIISVRSKDANGKTQPMSSADYFCIMYCTLTSFNFIIQLVINSIMYSIYGYEIAIIYTNIAAIVCITLANMVPNRREEDTKIKLEFTEKSLAIKQAFVRYLSHEMRTPINVAQVGLLMHQQSLEERDLLTPEYKEVLTDIKGAIDVALETLNEALDCEKLQSKVMALEKTKEDPLTFVLSSTSMFKASAVNAGVSLILPVAAEETGLANSWVEIDIRKMSQVMRNLMSNALKFTPAGSSVAVAMKVVEKPISAGKEDSVVSLLDSLFSSHQTKDTASEPWLEISVRDGGVGIEPEYLPRIFNEVLQINPNKNQGGKGTGMGLYISKGITELHGGRVEVHSDGLGQGSCFKVLLPLYLEQTTTPSTSKAGIRDLLTRKSASKVAPCDGTGGQGKRYNDNLPENNSDPHTKLDHSSAGNERLGADDSFLAVDSPTNLDHGSKTRESTETATGFTLLAAVLSNTGSRTSYDHSISASAHNTTTYASSLSKDEEQQPRRITGNWLSNERLHGQKVLMVDDSPTNLKMCVRLLVKLGAVVDKAEDGCVAVDRVRAALSAKLLEESEHQEQQLPPAQQPLPTGDQSVRSLPREGSSNPQPHRMYDLVLMDNQMPNMTGAEACKAMREMGFTGIIIGLTGNAFEQDIADYIAQGANAVLKKPLVLADLFETLRQIDATNRV